MLYIVLSEVYALPVPIESFWSALKINKGTRIFAEMIINQLNENVSKIRHIIGDTESTSFVVGVKQLLVNRYSEDLEIMMSRFASGKLYHMNANEEESPVSFSNDEMSLFSVRAAHFASAFVKLLHGRYSDCRLQSQESASHCGSNSDGGISSSYKNSLKVWSQCLLSDNECNSFSDDVAILQIKVCDYIEDLFSLAERLLSAAPNAPTTTASAHDNISAVQLIRRWLVAYALKNTNTTDGIMDRELHQLWL
jgi:hypothetical protein